MAEALFSINLKGELISATYYKIDDELLKRNLLDELLIDQILERSKNPERFLWNFDYGDIRVDILSSNSWKIEFFVSRNEPTHSLPKHLFKNQPKKIIIN